MRVKVNRPDAQELPFRNWTENERERGREELRDRKGKDTHV